jgi:hypothetical protein
MRLPPSYGLITDTTCQLDGSKYELKSHVSNHFLTTKTYHISFHKYTVPAPAVAEFWIGERHFEDKHKYGSITLLPACL